MSDSPFSHLPIAFVERIQRQFPNEWKDLLSSIETTSPISIRINPRKPYSIQNLEPVLWTRHGYYLDERPRFTLDPYFHAGGYYVQEASSMFLDYILQYLKSKIKLNRVLDLCAAPGGKSTIILDHLEPSQYLVANEIIPNRNLILRENLTKWGYPNFLITQNKPKDFSKLENQFDLIVLDAPCSGEGMFRKDPNAISEWAPHLAAMCADRQEDIFHTIWDSLREGGYLIYSTCTFNPDENEKLISRLARAYAYTSERISIMPEWNIVENEMDGIYNYQFLPHRVRGEGFFCTLIRKSGDCEPTAIHTSKSRIHPAAMNHLTANETLENYSTYKFEQSHFIAPNALLDDLNAYRSTLYIRQIGVEVLKQELPSHGLAMLAMQQQSSTDLDRIQALEYLSGDIPKDFPNTAGYQLASYGGLPLGYLQYEKSKWTNLYPKSLRIRMDWRG